MRKLLLRLWFEESLIRRPTLEPGKLSEKDQPGTQAIEALYKPGVLERLRAGVRAPDSKLAWESYVRAIERAIDPDLASPGRDVDRKSA